MKMCCVLCSTSDPSLKGSIGTVKIKVSDFPAPPGCHQPNSPWPGIIKLFPTRESLVNDIPAGDGKIANHTLIYIDPTNTSNCSGNLHTRQQDRGSDITMARNGTNVTDVENSDHAEKFLITINAPLI
jgi:hypothetical protein